MWMRRISCFIGFRDRGRDGWSIGFWNIQPCADANRDNFNGAIGIRIAIHALVLLMKRRRGIARVPGNGKLVALAGIANISRAD